MIAHQNHHRTLDWHYDVTMDYIMMSEVIITSRRYHYSVALITLVLELVVFIHSDFKIYTLAWNDIEPLYSRI